MIDTTSPCRFCGAPRLDEDQSRLSTWACGTIDYRYVPVSPSDTCRIAVLEGELDAAREAADVWDKQAILASANAHQCMQDNLTLQAGLDAARRERDTLREALKRIASGDYDQPHPYRTAASLVARAALADAATLAVEETK